MEQPVNNVDWQQLLEQHVTSRPKDASCLTSATCSRQEVSRQCPKPMNNYQQSVATEIAVDEVEEGELEN